MIKQDLYLYQREVDKYTTSPNKPDIDEYELLVRIIADEGMLLTNGEVTMYCVDIRPDEVDNWFEIEAPEEPDLEDLEENNVETVLHDDKVG